MQEFVKKTGRRAIIVISSLNHLVISTILSTLSRESLLFRPAIRYEELF